tara:strand:- start:1295 stop:3478 length:2184 start_codon:yes stop_codon:yes gene_type:complete
MLIKLPIIINEQIDIINFKLDKYDNKFIVKPLNNADENIYKVMVSNKEFCLNTFSVNFPLEFDIIENNFIFSKFFFITAVSNGFDCELNFFSNVLKYIKKFNNKLKFLDLNYITKNTENVIKKCNLQISIRKKFENLNDFKIYIDNQLNYSINLIYLMIYKFYDFNTKDFKNNNINSFIPKKIINCFNLVKSFKIIYKGSKSISIIKHIENLKNNNIIEKSICENESYFIKFDNQKIIKYRLVDFDENFIFVNGKKLSRDNCKIFNYNPELINQLTFNYLIKEIVKYDYELKILISSRIFKSEEKDIQNIIKYFYENNQNFILLSSLRNLDLVFNTLKLDHYNDKDVNLELKVLEDGYVNNDYMLFISNKYSDNIESKLKVLKVLFDKYTFPLAFNKKKLNTNFEMIIYFSLLNYSDFISIIDSEKITLTNEIIEIIPVKLKNLYFNILKTFYQLKNNSLENITYNFKYYQDYIYIYVVKNIIQNNSIVTSLFTECDLYNRLIEVYSKNYILSQLILDINWVNLSNKLNHLDYIYQNNNLIFYQNKLNRNLFSESIDYKVKGIILDKISMYKYLKKEKDFIKWTKFIKKYIFEIYEKEISMSNDDLSDLGKLLFKIYNLDNQNLKDDKYIDLINFSKNKKKLILINSRINLMLKEKFHGIKCQLNLGFFAKHLNSNNFEKIELDDDENYEVKKIKNDLKEVTKKYYKYKGKYMKTKTTTSTDINLEI